jgi:hypothetical protein
VISAWAVLILRQRRAAAFWNELKITHVARLLLHRGLRIVYAPQTETPEDTKQAIHREINEIMAKIRETTFHSGFATRLMLPASGRAEFQHVPA